MTEESDDPDYLIGDETRSVEENVQSKMETRLEKKREIRVKRGVERVMEHIAVGEYRSAGMLLDARVLPALDIDRNTSSAVHDIMMDSDLPWYVDSVEAFLRSPEKYIRAAPERGDRLQEYALENAINSANGYQSPTRRAQSVIEEVAECAHSAAIGQGIIPRELDRSSAVVGLSQQVGMQWTAWEMDVPDPVTMARDDKELPFTLCIGDVSSGKSTAVATLTLDRYYADHKIIDIHDRKKLENGVYDLLQRQENLKEVRRELGLAGTFDEADEEPPDVEIRVPLSDSLSEKEVLHYPDGECRIEPFAVDVASLPKTLLTAFIGDLTKTQSEEWQRVLELIDDDWTLTDLAEMVMEGPADDPVKRGLLSRIRRMQESGWIRDSDCDYLIDWHELFEDTDTITAFSTSLMGDERDKYRVFLYLLDTVYREREKRQDRQYPPASVIIRELHHVTPVRTNRAEDPVKERIQKQIAARMRSIASESGHENIELITDTQHWGQIAKRVREHVNVIVMFRLAYNAANRVFDEVMGGVSHRYVRKVTEQETGEATIIADNQRIHGEGKSFRFIQPVQFAPPMCHHVDRESEISTGWAAREAFTDEELAPPPEGWPIDLPDRLEIDGEGESEGGLQQAAREFHEACIETDDYSRLPRVDLLDAFNAFAGENGYELLDDVGELADLLEDVGTSLERGSGVKARKSDLVRDEAEYDKRQPYAYGGIELNSTGENYLS